MSLNTTRHNPCPVCGKDGCSYTRDKTAVMCRRVEEGSVKPIGSWAWLHRLEDRPEEQRMVVSLPRKPKPPLPEAGMIARDAYAAMHDTMREQLAIELGLSAQSLTALGVGYSRRDAAYTFPMRMANGKICGIRLRSIEDGSKYAVKGSRAGLFIPNQQRRNNLWICEGPTDTAALHGLGFCVIGRDCCTGGREDISLYIKRHSPTNIIIVADPDEPGQKGAASLRAYLGRGRIVTPPAKDVRAWVGSGAGRHDVMSLIEGGAA